MNMDDLTLSERPSSSKSETNSFVDSGCMSEETEEKNDVVPQEIENCYSAFNDDFEFLTMATVESDPQGIMRSSLYENLKEFVSKAPISKRIQEIEIESAIELSDGSFTDETGSEKWMEMSSSLDSKQSLLCKKDLPTKLRSKRRRRKKSCAKLDSNLVPQRLLETREKKVEDITQKKKGFQKRAIDLSPVSSGVSSSKPSINKLSFEANSTNSAHIDPQSCYCPSSQNQIQCSKAIEKISTVKIVRAECLGVRSMSPQSSSTATHPDRLSVSCLFSPRDLLNVSSNKMGCSPTDFIHPHIYCDPLISRCVSQETNRTTPFNPESRRLLRPIFVDGCNISFEHGKHDRYSAIGLEIVFIYFWKKYGYDSSNFTIVQRPGGFKSTEDQAILNYLFKMDLLIFTPRRHVGREVVISDDDLFLLTMAKEKGGIVISKDQFRDVYEKTDDPKMKELIEKRILQFAFKGNEVWFPQDPLGKDGPTLEEFLRF